MPTHLISLYPSPSKVGDRLQRNSPDATHNFWWHVTPDTWHHGRQRGRLRARPAAPSCGSGLSVQRRHVRVAVTARQGQTVQARQVVTAQFDVQRADVLLEVATTFRAGDGGDVA